MTLFVAILIFMQTNFLFFKLLDLKQNQNATVEVKVAKLEEEQLEEKSRTSTVEENWRLIIPKINLNAEIKDGTEGEIINSYIGHFKETAHELGNIGLAAHNEGYKENYFKDLDKLEKEDSIIYEKGGFRKEYKVIENCIIEETNWTYLRNTQDNRITLITCIANNPTKRRCVQAVEI